MKMIKIGDPRTKLLVAFIVLIALFLRLYDLGSLPNGLYCDEAANGYDSYSIIKTGKSLYGNKFPLFFLHHGIDYVESLYTYLSVPFISFCGLSVFSTRLLAAVAGTCTVLTTFLLAKQLFNKWVGLLAATLLAVSPWHLVFSRIAFRGILLPLFLTFGIFLFLKWLENRKYCVPCALIFGLAFHTYAVGKAFIPLVIIVLLLFYHKKILSQLKSDSNFRKHFIIAAILFLVLTIPVYTFSLFGPGNLRFQEISVFNCPNPIRQFFHNYSLHLTLDFLFFYGDANPRHSVPTSGQFFPILLPFFLLGMLVSFRKWKPAYFLPPVIFLLAIVPSALTNERVPHALRAIGALPFLEITAAVGFVSTFSFLSRKSKWIGRAILVIFPAFLLLNSIQFLSTYFGKYRMISQYVFQYGMEEAILTAEQQSNDLGHIVLSPSINMGYIFVLFYSKSDPGPYQENQTLGKYLAPRSKTEKFSVPPGRNLYILRSRKNNSEKGEPHTFIRGVNDKVFLTLVKPE